MSETRASHNFCFVDDEKIVVRPDINELYLADEEYCLDRLVDTATVSGPVRREISDCARTLVQSVRKKSRKYGGLDAFLHEYNLSSREGVILLCLAEALLRIPDIENADRLIVEKLSSGVWNDHMGHSASLFVNASTWGLMLTGRFTGLEEELTHEPAALLKNLVARAGQGIVRKALHRAMQILSEQFILGRNIHEAISNSAAGRKNHYRYSFDMLGEAALCQADADLYLAAYNEAIEALQNNAADSESLPAADNISIKLTALHPRFEFGQRQRVLAELGPRLLELAGRARQCNVALTIDAEDADRLDLTLDLFEILCRSPLLKGWNGIGLAVQAYQKRAPAVIDWLKEVAESTARRIPLRLVKGAYWDHEIKKAQMHGFSDYPVFTRKMGTDVSYIACVRKIFLAGDIFYPQFATHNAYTVATVAILAPPGCDFEFQRLQGMGQALYEEIVPANGFGIPCRIYAPVGDYHTLLPYLVRRLLENGANTSFLNRIANEQVPVDKLIDDPVERLRRLQSKRHPRIPVPEDLFAPKRRNSGGLNLADCAVADRLSSAMNAALSPPRTARPLINGERLQGKPREVTNPADRRHIIGYVVEGSDRNVVDNAVTAAIKGFREWSRIPVAKRADCLELAADRIEKNAPALMALCVCEGGKTVPDAMAEVREAVDYCRYYASLARHHFGSGRDLLGPVGERNELAYFGRGVFVCISPWNFPLAIFVGQMCAALVSGNSVIVKPAHQTPLIANLAVEYFLDAGVPESALHCIPGSGAVVGTALIQDRRIAGVAFTGSTDTAWNIRSLLAANRRPIVPFIAETGGMNAMIVDSSALTEQVVQDALSSAFNSAGQRCSALRVLYLQEDIADRTIELLVAAMAELRLGNPALLTTDVGPVIDDTARDRLLEHEQYMCKEGKLLGKLESRHETGNGSFFAPCIFEIERLDQLPGEIFGPILHVIRYRYADLDRVLEEINSTGYGLTMGLQSRIAGSAETLRRNARVGNLYVNRNMIGAAVGVQPFGGEGLSGTGPKAGGPHYLHPFVTERTVTINTSAIGGNVRLLNLDDEEDTESR